MVAGKIRQEEYNLRHCSPAAARNVFNGIADICRKGKADIFRVQMVIDKRRL